MSGSSFTTTLEHVVEIDVSPETVFAMWTTAHGVCAWWGVSAEVDARPGGLIRVCLEGGPIMRGEHLTLEATATGSRVILRHHDLPLEHFGNHAHGWTHFFGSRFVAVLSGRPNEC